MSQRVLRAETVDRLETAVADADARVRAADDQAEAASRDASEARRAGHAAQLRAAEAEARAQAAERLAAIHAADAEGPGRVQEDLGRLDGGRLANAAVRAAAAVTAEFEAFARAG